MTREECIYCDKKLVPLDLGSWSAMSCGICKKTIGFFCRECFANKMPQAAPKARKLRDEHDESHNTVDLV